MRLKDNHIYSSRIELANHKRLKTFPGIDTFPPMNASLPSLWKSVAQGLTLKLLAMWLIFPSMLFPFIFHSHIGLMLAAIVPLSIDLVGRCYCARAPVNKRAAIRISILAQSIAILALAVLAIVAGLPGVILGLVLAVAFQISAAKWFIAHLKLIALYIDQPSLASNLDQLQRRLLATTLSTYGTGAIIVIVLPCAFLIGLMAYGIGLIITLPFAFLIITPVLVSSMVLYFFMLFSYERTLRELRDAIFVQTQTRSADAA